ncbi:MAG: LacI family DNA-binding transcriptional regulator [Pseudarthrobacter sp.]
MKDVAKLAGVSHQTVSRVLNGHPNVSAKARERVEAAISELGYRRNSIARTLVTRRSQTIGVLASDLSQYGPARTLLGLEQAARAAGYFVSIATLREITVDSVSDALEHFRDQGVDGIIVIVPHPGILEALDALQPGVPVVAATSDSRRHSPGAAVDQRMGARMAVQHLIDLGHTRIGHVSGPMEWFDAAERVEGWREALADAGLAPGLLLHGDWSADSGYVAGSSLGPTPEVTAMFVANDQMALGLLRALHEQQLVIPRDVSVVGYDDQPEAGHFYPPLTTVRQDFEELGRQCISALLTSLEEGVEGGKRLVEPKLVLRATTAPPASAAG